MRFRSPIMNAGQPHFFRPCQYDSVESNPVAMRTRRFLNRIGSSQPLIELALHCRVSATWPIFRSWARITASLLKSKSDAQFLQCSVSSAVEWVASSESTTQLQQAQKNSKHSGQQCACHVRSPCRSVTQVVMATIDMTGFVFVPAFFVRTQRRPATHLDKDLVKSFFSVIVFNILHFDADVVVVV